MSGEWSMDGAELFFVIGMQRCGTTYLAELLRDHPDIAVATPLRPEPKFFMDDELYAQGASYYLREYVPGWGVRGSKATSYIESPKALDRIARDLPGAKLVVVLRDPVDRAVSNYRFSVENGLEHEDVESALTRESMGSGVPEAQSVSVSPFAYLSRGLYVQHLERVWARFRREQVGVFFLEELVASQDAVGSVYQFLDVDPCYRSSAFARVVNASEKRLDMPSSVESFLTRYFAEPNRRLARELGRELPGWRAPGSGVVTDELAGP